MLLNIWDGKQRIRRQVKNIVIIGSVLKNQFNRYFLRIKLINIILQIVPIERLRSKSQEPPLNKMTFNKVDIALPSEIKEYYATTPEEKQAELHADFKNAINAAKIQFEKVSGTPTIEHQKIHLQGHVWK